MRERIAFQMMVEGDDEFGNPAAGGWETQFEEPARLKPGIGSETMIASRIAGVQPYTMTIQSSLRTRQITPAWRAVDVRAGNKPDGKPRRVFDIKAIANPDEWQGALNLVVVETS